MNFYPVTFSVTDGQTETIAQKHRWADKKQTHKQVLFISGQDDSSPGHVTDFGFGQMDALQDAGLNDTEESEETENSAEIEGTVLHSFECSSDKTETHICDNAYTSDVLKNLDEARKDGTFCDITLLIGPDKHPIRAHRLILASASEYFKVMFTTGLKEGGQSEVELPKADVLTMKLLIDFIYTGKMTVTNENIEKIITAANFFGIAKIVQKCINYIMDKINHNNSIEILEFAERISNKDLKEFAMKFIVTHFDAISSKNLDIMQMTTPLLLNIIAMLGTVIHENPTENEERLFQLGWNHLQSKPDNVLDKFLPKLLQRVHLPCVSDEFLADLARKFGDHEAANTIIVKAKYVKSNLTHFKTPEKQIDDMMSVLWASRRFRKTGTVTVTCDGLRNDSSLYWMSVPALISGLAFCLRVSIQKPTGDGPPVNYLTASILCTNIEVTDHKSLSCTIQLNLIAPRISRTFGDFTHIFMASGKYSRPRKVMKVTEALACCREETDKCTVTAKITIQPEVSST